MNPYEVNLLRSRARRRGLDFGKNKRAPTDDNLGGYRVWRIATGEILAGLVFDLTGEQVRDVVEAEIARLDALSGRYRAPRRRSLIGGEAA